MSPSITPGGGGGGGSQAGAPIVRAFPFAFNTPSLVDGAALYTPAVGDVLLDLWLEIGTAWNGTTPKGDITAGLTNTGFLNNLLGQTFDMTAADTTRAGGPFIGVQLSDMAQASTLTWPTSNQGDGLYAVAGAAVNFIATPVTFGTRVFPAKFVTAAQPIKFTVSQSGAAGGDDPGATQGSATLYLVTATPA